MAASSACVGVVPEPVEGSRTTEIGAVPGAAIGSFSRGAGDSRMKCLKFYSSEMRTKVLRRMARAQTFGNDGVGGQKKAALLRAASLQFQSLLRGRLLLAVAGFDS